jgi:hypothetical protein
LLAWFGCAVMAMVAYANTEPSGESFLRGANRLGVFLGWHAGGAVFALLAFVASRPLAPGWTRHLTLWPLALYGAIVALVLGLILWARLQILFMSVAA